MTKRTTHRFGALALGLLTAAILAAPAALAHPRVSVGFGFGFAGPGYYAPYPPYPGPYYDVPDHALVDTDVSPEQASVYLDGERVGIADNYDGFPRYLAVSPGRHTLEFRASGYRTLRVRLYAQPGAMYDIERDLNRSSRSDASPQDMTLGEPDAPTRPHVRPRSVPPRRDESGDRDDDDRGRPDDDQSESYPDDSRDRPGSNPPDREPSQHDGTIVFKIRPDDAAVYVDGKFLGAGESLGGPGGVSVSSGTHRVQIVKPGYEPYRTTVEVRSGGTRPVTIQLRRSSGGDDEGRDSDDEDEGNGP